VQPLGLKQAEHYHSILEKSFQFLCENPLAARERTEITPPVRMHPIESHIIVYSVDERDEIFIIRVRNGVEDWGK
jgi:toxin ParE1/3/4